MYLMISFFRDLIFNENILIFFMKNKRKTNVFLLLRLQLFKYHKYSSN